METLRTNAGIRERLQRQSGSSFENTVGSDLSLRTINRVQQIAAALGLKVISRPGGLVTLPGGQRKTSKA